MTTTQCPQCKGRKRVRCTIHSGGKVSTMDLTCPSCDGTGKVTEAYKRALESFWCKCGNPSGQTQYYPDGASATCSKHHWACNDCGRVVQVG